MKPAMEYPSSGYFAYFTGIGKVNTTLSYSVRKRLAVIGFDL
jgi:hypothetical protein